MKSNIPKLLTVIISLWAISTLLLCGKSLWAELAPIPYRYIDDFHHYREVSFEEPVVLEWAYFEKLLEEIDHIDIQNTYLFLGHIITSLLLLVISLAYLNLRKKIETKTSGLLEIQQLDMGAQPRTKH